MAAEQFLNWAATTVVRNGHRFCAKNANKPKRAGSLPDARHGEGRLEAKICREHALQCAVMALAAERPSHRQLFTRLFQAWTNLAIDLEGGERPGSPPAIL
jgi:hypothetical protein